MSGRPVPSAPAPGRPCPPCPCPLRWGPHPAGCVSGPRTARCSGARPRGWLGAWGPRKSRVTPAPPPPAPWGIVTQNRSAFAQTIK